MTEKPTRKRRVRPAEGEAAPVAGPGVEAGPVESAAALSSGDEILAAEAPAVVPAVVIAPEPVTSEPVTNERVTSERVTGDSRLPEKEGFEALIEAQSHLAHGVAEIRIKVLDFTEASFASAAATARKLAAAKSLVDVMELNGAFAAAVFDKFVETTGKIGAIGLDTASKVSKPVAHRLLPLSGG